MTKDDIQLLYEYDRWANNRILQAVSALSVEQFTSDLGGGIRCDLIRDTETTRGRKNPWTTQ
jgi:hypothetical protein